MNRKKNGKTFLPSNKSTKITCIFLCIGITFCLLFLINILYLHKQPASSVMLISSSKIHDNNNNNKKKNNIMSSLSKTEPGNSENNQIQTINNKKIVKKKFNIENSKKIQIHHHKNNVKHPSSKKRSHKKFSRDNAIAKELYKLETHLHMLKKEQRQSIDSSKGSRPLSSLNIKNINQVSAKQLLLKNVNSIPFDEVSNAAKSTAKNAKTAEERVLHLCTDNVKKTLKMMENDPNNENSIKNIRQPNTLRVMQYNVYDGIKNEHRKKWIGEYIKNNVIDVLTLNELNDWDKRYMNEMSKLWGFKYDQLLITGEYNLGIMSQYPITILSYHTGGTFHHGFLHVRINHPKTPFRVVVTHLSPWESKKRLLEVQALLMVVEGARMPTHTIYVKIYDGPRVPVTLPDMEKTHVKSILNVLQQTWNEEERQKEKNDDEGWGLYNGNKHMDQAKTLLDYNICDGDELHYQPINAHVTHGEVPINRQCSSDSINPYQGEEPLLIMGDLNSLSKLDAASYDQSKLLKHILSIPAKDTKKRLVNKFLKESTTFRDKYRIDYGPIEMLLNFGYIDFLGKANVESGMFHHTVPTMLKVDYMHAQRMRLDYIIGNREFEQKYGQCVNVHTMQSACSEILSDHLPILLTFKTDMDGTSTANALNNKKEKIIQQVKCEKHRIKEDKMKSCSWDTLCKWKQDWDDMKQLLKVERVNLCNANKDKWEMEEHGIFHSKLPNNINEWWYTPIKNEMVGKSCDDTCQNIFSHTGDDMSNRVPVEPNLYDEAGKLYKESFCIGSKLQSIDTCERLKVAFDCIYGCAEVEGPDQPSFVDVENDQYFGHCLHNPSDKYGTCSGHHHSTARLCPCSFAKFTIQKGTQGQSCKQVCNTVDSVCLEPLLRKIDDCSVLQKHFDCKKCEKMTGKDLPAFVSNIISEYKGTCFINAGNDKKKGKEAKLDCDGKHSDTTRLCACAKASSNGRSEVEVVKGVHKKEIIDHLGKKDTSCNV